MLHRGSIAVAVKEHQCHDGDAEGVPGVTTYPHTPYLAQAAGDTDGLKLFCFHHAGGAASTFSSWQGVLGPTVMVLAVQLPGRERRAAEPRFTDMDALIADLNEQLGPLLDGPHAFYGHSMGALIAYKLTQARASGGQELPTRLMVGAYPPPHAPAPIGMALELSDVELTRFLVDIGGMSELITRYPDWVRAALRLTRDDLRLCQSCQPHSDPPLPCPIDVFTGESDPLLPPAKAAEWDKYSTAGCHLHTIPGGHFFIHDSRTVFLSAVAAALSGMDALPL
jgi:surfactin synthase thioesterase subunit